MWLCFFPNSCKILLPPTTSKPQHPMWAPCLQADGQLLLCALLPGWRQYGRLTRPWRCTVLAATWALCPFLVWQQALCPMAADQTFGCLHSAGTETLTSISSPPKGLTTRSQILTSRGAVLVQKGKKPSVPSVHGTDPMAVNILKLHTR